MQLPSQPEKQPLAHVLGNKLWTSALIIGFVSTFLLAGLMIEADAFEQFYSYSRDHEDWNLDEWAMAFLAAILVTAFSFSMMALVLARRLIRAESGRQAAELKTMRAHQLATLGTMVAGTAHSINNHLLPIITLLSLFRKQLPLTSQQSLDFEKVLAASRSVAEIVSRMKSFAKTNHEVNGTCDVESATLAAIDLARIAIPAAVRLEADIQHLGYEIQISQAAWQVVVLNLINNAIESMEGRNGHVVVSLGRANNPGFETASTESNNWAVFRVSDTGKGIASDALPRIFEPFFTTKAFSSGSGLGLSESYGIVQAGGGRIEVRSEVGQGTEMKVWLPAASGVATHNS